MKQIIFTCHKGCKRIDDCAEDQAALPNTVPNLMVYHPIELPHGFFPECVECKDNEDEGLYLGGLKDGNPNVRMYKSCNLNIEMVG